MGTTALKAAKLACSASGWTLTNLQLQKLLYIAHMLHAGRGEGHPLIEDEAFEAWDYGPVLPSVYRRASAFGNRPVGNIFHGVGEVEEQDVRELIENTVKKLSKMDAFRLVEIVHEPQGAWHRHYEPGVRGIVIPQEDIKGEYLSRFANAG